MPDQSKLITVPDGKLGIIALKSSEKLGKKVDEYLVRWRKERADLDTKNLMFNGYTKDSYLIEKIRIRRSKRNNQGFSSWNRPLHPCRRN